MIAARAKPTTRSSAAGCALASCTPPAAATSAVQKLPSEKRKSNSAYGSRSQSRGPASGSISESIARGGKPGDLLETTLFRQLDREIEEGQVDRAERTAHRAVEQGVLGPVRIARRRRERERLLTIHGISPR